MISFRPADCGRWLDLRRRGGGAARGSVVGRSIARRTATTRDS